MCTVLLLYRPGHDWPVLLAGNRDEMADRPADPPGHHWLDRPHVIAGLDRLGGGSWMGLNGHGVFAVILNRAGSLGPQEGKRSRGELPLEALDHADAADAAQALADLDGTSYRPFNMMIVDNCSAFWIKSEGKPKVRAFPIAPGFHMLTAHDLDDPDSSRISHNLPAFRQAPVPDPERGNWDSWIDILTNGKGMNFRLPNTFGTVSSSLVALPSVDAAARKPIWLYTHTPPGEGVFKPVNG